MSKITETRAKSWQHAIDLLYADSFDDSICRYRSPFAFRGVADKSWCLETSLIRLGGPIANLERHLLRNFCKYAHNHVDQTESMWFWLTFGQHHGLPTRLLDWTYSPFVALHFATSNVSHFDRDGCIWMVDYAESNRRSPKLLSDALEREGPFVFSTEMLTQFETPEQTVKTNFMIFEASSTTGGIKRISSLKDFDDLSEQEFMIFFEPPSIDDRVVNQFALFSVISNAERTVDDFLKRTPELARRVIIPKEIKPEIRDKLDQANINERVLFPGLDGLSEWLRRHYGSFE
jgi:hypothetical protein